MNARSQLHHRGSRGRVHGLASLPRRAFTLVEVMISIALVLLLMYGVSQVFKLSGDAVSANQAVSSIVRDHRATAATMAEDFRNCVQDSPMFLISSRIAYNGPANGANAAPFDKVNGVDVHRGFAAGFRTAEEQRNNGDPDPTWVNGAFVTDKTGARSFMPLLGSDRVPRLDRLGFFVRNRYRRLMFAAPTGSPAPQAMTSTEAYVWYGHTMYPRPKAHEKDSNWFTSYNGVYMQLPENQFAADRILGRVTVLMKHVPASSSSGAPYFPKHAPSNPLLPDEYVWPFNWTAFGFALGIDAPTVNYASDVAPVSIDEFRASVDNSFLQARTNNYSGPEHFYVPMEDYLDPANANNTRVTRFVCKPTIERPIDESQLALTAPYFLGHCTQFIVEYAGDFLKQAEFDPADLTVPPGAVTDAAQYTDGSGNIYTGQTDGKIDYVIDTSGDIDPTTGKLVDPPKNPDKWVRRIRWYGLPRDINGDGRITINDVVPLADVLRYYWKTGSREPHTFVTPAGFSGAPSAPWEKTPPSPTPPPKSRMPLDDQSLLDNTLPTRQYETLWQQNYANFKGDPQTFQYICAWHNDAPLMIRVLVKIDDPTGKLQDGQWYEYVFSR